MSILVLSDSCNERMDIEENLGGLDNDLEKQKCKPDDFLSEEFRIHSEIFLLPNRDDYMMLSSGINEFPTPEIWKKTMKEEIDGNFLYQQYSSLSGFQTVTSAVKLYERFLFSEGDIFFSGDLEVCMTIGASQAVDLSLAYLKSIGKKKILLVGMMYPIYITLGEQYDYQIVESRSHNANKDMPTVEKLENDILQTTPDVIVFSYPSNPSGEIYSDVELYEIMKFLKNKKEIYCIFDCACNNVMSQKKIMCPEKVIQKSDMRKRCIIVNSFSKTDSVPGLRIGYIVSHYDMIMYARSQQVDIMNPPNIPTIGIWMVLLFRCIYLSEVFGQGEAERHRIKKCFKRIFLFTTSLCSQSVRDYAIDLIEVKFKEEYLKYKIEMFEQENVIERNKTYAIEKLALNVEETTQMESGFNFLVKFRKGSLIDELELCRQLLHKTGIAVFTESSFAISRKWKNNYWVRISLAVPCEKFKKAIDDLNEFLDNMK